MASLGRAFLAAVVCAAQDCGKGEACEDHVTLLAHRQRAVRQRASSGLEACVSASATMSFADFVTRYERGYAPGSGEYEMRQALFEDRQKDVLHHNCQPERSWSATVNHLSDWTEEERSRLLGWKHDSAPAGASLLQEAKGEEEADDEVQPSADTFRPKVDWNLTAVNLPFVPDQGSCGSCWAVASVNLLHSHLEIYNKKKDLHLSIQDLVDCVDNPRHCGGTGGCEGATVELAINYLMTNRMNPAELNKYVKRGGNKKACNPQGGGISAADIGLKSFRTLPSNKAWPVVKALQNGPLAVAIDANSQWFGYSSGIVNGCNKDETDINHAVLLTGYGKEKGKPYYKILNSWGKHWGEDGFIRLVRKKSWKNEQKNCAMDNKPQDGIDCEVEENGEPGPTQVTVCGTCGILYDIVALKFKSKPLMKLTDDGFPLLDTP